MAGLCARAFAGQRIGIAVANAPLLVGAHYDGVGDDPGDHRIPGSPWQRLPRRPNASASGQW
jgi:hypothetical protein